MAAYFIICSDKETGVESVLIDVFQGYDKGTRIYTSVDELRKAIEYYTWLQPQYKYHARDIYLGINWKTDNVLKVAKEIYDTFPGADKHPWKDGSTSTMQDKAWEQARKKVGI